jgi:predicted O-linked N-acetylglucosamine transferase (SPINDLY family)
MAEWQRQAGLDQPPQGGAGDGRIRLGIVMAQFWNHSVWLAIVKGWVAHLDRARFSVHLFHTGPRDDAETAWARAHADSFTQAAPGTAMGLEDWVRAIQAAAPDVLIYPEFGMDHITMRLASMRLAPVQAASWGHPETTGLPVMDHYISAAAFEPPEADNLYSENLLRLPRLGCSYERLPVTAAAFDLASIGIPPGTTLMVCPGTPFKYTPETDALLVDIARRVPDGRLLFFTYQRSAALSQRVTERIAAAFRDAGMDFSRHAVLLPWLPRAHFYHLLQRADLMLDTVGFSGFNTVMQALECGLPVATMEGRFLRGRLGSGILRTMGMDELVATDTAAYVDIATRLATDKAFNATARQRIAERREGLFDDVETVRELEAFLERAVRQPG